MAKNTWIKPALKWLGVVLIKYGPEIWQWLRKNPDVADAVQHQATRLKASSGLSDEAMRVTLHALTEQVGYLRDSADNDDEVTRATKWAAELTKLEHAVAVLGDGAKKAERKRVRVRIDVLRGKVLSAFLDEQIEDAGGPAPIEDTSTP